MTMPEMKIQWMELMVVQWLSGKETACNARAAGNVGSIPRSGISSGEGNDNPLQHSCLENPMDRGSEWATVHGVVRVRHD